jgi:CxxC motif-containing protein (DUF1111 family)
MERGTFISRSIRLFGVGGVAAAICGGASFGQAPPPPLPPLGAPLPNLTSAELNSWRLGQQKFAEQEAPSDGLGPVFNARSCVACHHSGAIGGSSADFELSRVTRIGGIVNGAYSDLVAEGGPVIEAHSLKEIDPNYPYPGERVPAGTPFVSHRMTTPIFGDGLIEAISWSTLRDLSQKPQPDGIHGLPNWVINPETGGWEIGRFGWKAQLSSLHVFSGDAYLNEVGITSKSFPKDNMPQGRTDPAGADKVADPEDGSNDVMQFTMFMRLTAPPPPVPLSLQAQHGQQLFASMNCASCHTPSLSTGTYPIAALSNKTARLYSDLLLHHMGVELSDGVRQGSAAGDQWKSAPLWGLRFRQFFLHDGRASTVDQAILMHGGEASAARNRYENLSPGDKGALLDFLGRI